MGRQKLLILGQKCSTELCFFELLGDPCGFLWETTPRIFGKAGQISIFSGFITKIVVQVPELFCKAAAFIALSFSQLYIGRKVSVLQKLSNALSCVLP